MDQFGSLKTVLPETAWVLRRYYKYEQSAIVEALASLPELEHVHIEDEDSVRTALHRFMSRGIDPADAMHLASTPAGARFATFDPEDLVRRAKSAQVQAMSLLSQLYPGRSRAFDRECGDAACRDRAAAQVTGVSHAMDSSS